MRFYAYVIFSSLMLSACNPAPKQREVECEVDGELKSGEFCYDIPVTFANSSGAPNSNLLFEDWNQDGHLDMSVVGLTGQAFIFELILGDGLGGLTSEVKLSFASPPLLQAADLDGDGDPDLVVGEGSSLQILTQEGGNFFFRTSLELDFPITDLALADFDRDGSVDIACSSLATVVTLRNTGAALFEPPVVTLLAGSGDRLLVSDVNQDASPDLIVLNQNIGAFSDVVLLTNIGGTFPAQQLILPAARSIDLTLSDLNDDGLPELILLGSGGTVQILFNDESNSFAEGLLFSLVVDDVTLQPLGVTAGDFDGDGSIDIAVVDQTLGNISVVQNGGRAKFKRFFSVPANMETARVGSLSAKDLNEDGLLDFITATATDLRISFAQP